MGSTPGGEARKPEPITIELLDRMTALLSFFASPAWSDAHDHEWDALMELMWAEGVLPGILGLARRALEAESTCGECGGALMFIEQGASALRYKCAGCNVLVSKIRPDR